MIRAPALAATLLLACSAAAGATLAPADYARMVNESARGLERAAAAGKKGEQPARAALARLPQRAEIGAAAGAPPLEVDNRALLRALRRQVAKGPQGIRGAAQVLRSLQQSVGAQARPAPADSRRVLADVLARREFRPSRIATLSEKIAAWFARVLNAVFRRLPSPPDLPEGLARALLWGTLALAAGAAVFLVVRLALGAAGAARRGPTGPELESAAPKPGSAWLAEAEAAVRAGDYRAAMRALYLAALMRLDDAGHLRYDGAVADGRFVQALRAKGRPDLAQALAALGRLFSPVWYGAAPAGLEEYSAAQARWRELEVLTAS